VLVSVELTSRPTQSQGAGQNEKVLIDTWSEEQGAAVRMGLVATGPGSRLRALVGGVSWEPAMTG